LVTFISKASQLKKVIFFLKLKIKMTKIIFDVSKSRGKDSIIALLCNDAS